MIPFFFDDVVSAVTANLFTADVAALIERVDADFVVLAEIQPMEILSVWTPSGGSFPNVYWAVFNSQDATDVVKGGLYRRLDEVRQDNVKLSQRASVNDCNNNLGSYYYDVATGVLFVSTTTGVSPDTFEMMGAWFTIFFSTTSIAFSDFPLYTPMLTGTLPTVTEEMPDPLFGSIVASNGAIEIVNTDKLFDKLSRRYVWRNKTVTLKLGGRALDYADFQTFETLKINSITVDDEVATLQLENQGSVLNQSIPRRTWGDGTVDVGREVTDPTQGVSGLSQPIVLGTVQLVPGIFAGTIGGNEVWYLTDTNTGQYGSYSIPVAYWVDRAVRSGSQLLGGEYAVTAGQIDILNPTYNHDTYDIVANVTNIGTLPSARFGTMAAAILRICGESDDNIDLSAFVAADVAAPQVLARYIGTPVIAADVMMELCQSVNGQVYQDYLGRWTCRLIRPDIPDAYAALTDADFVSWTPRADLTTSLNEVRVRHSHRPYLDDWIEETASDDATAYANENSDSHRIETWLTSSVDAGEHAHHMRFLKSRAGMTIEAEQRGLGLLRARAGDLVSVTRQRGPIGRTGTLDGHLFRIVKIEKALGPEAPVVKVWLNDLHGQTDRIGRCLDADVDIDWSTATAAQRATYLFCSDTKGYIDPADPQTRHAKVPY